MQDRDWHAGGARKVPLQVCRIGASHDLGLMDEAGDANTAAPGYCGDVDRSVDSKRNRFYVLGPRLASCASSSATRTVMASSFSRVRSNTCVCTSKSARVTRSS